MCLTIPAKVISINKNKAKVKIGKKKQLVNSQLVDVKKGDWVLIQNNFIINKVNLKQVREINKLILNK